MAEPVQKIAVGFKGASELIGMSPRYLELAAKNPDPALRLKTVRVARRRLIKVSDLEDWFQRVLRDEQASEKNGGGSEETQAA